MGKDKFYFVKIHSETDIIKMLDFLIDNISVTLGERVFQQIEWELLRKKVGS